MLPDFAIDRDAAREAQIVPDPLEPTEHGPLCTPQCAHLAVRSTLHRIRAPLVACPHCGAEPGQECIVVGRRQLRLHGRLHPSRIEAA